MTARPADQITRRIWLRESVRLLTTVLMAGAVIWCLEHVLVLLATVAAVWRGL